MDAMEASESATSRRTRYFSIEEDEAMLKYLAERSKSTRLHMTTLWQAFKEDSGSARSSHSLAARFKANLASRIPEILGIDEKTKVTMLFASNTPVGGQFLEDLRKNADVELDEKWRIVKYKEHAEDGLELVDEAFLRRFTEKEDAEIVQFVADKAKDSAKRLSMTAVWSELETSGLLKRTATALQTRFKNHIARKIHRMEEIPVETRVRMLFAASVPVDEHFLSILRHSAEVTVDEKGKLLFYKAANGTELRSNAGIKRKRAQMAMDAKRRAEKPPVIDMEAMLRGLGLNLAHIKQETPPVTERVESDSDMSLSEVEIEENSDTEHHPMRLEQFLEKENPEMVTVRVKQEPVNEPEVAVLSEQCPLSVMSAGPSPPPPVALDNSVQKIDELMTTMKSFMMQQLVSTGSAPQVPANSSATKMYSMKSFLLLFKGFVFGIDVPELAEYRQILNKALQEPMDEQVSLDRVVAYVGAFFPEFLHEYAT
ncbi:unnamed protein product [Caenorhabditis sp. 36 PRJEB53466]|nr:unnamed protein product [Caenorhabditis sp. 36 PRJEB53466]